ncbi:MAG: hypothetical protein EOP51_07280 [Sphingobacteriales bacterium]|nr:MAG: hypothetical protein EOP51_07280 [Sphingobacteriales bacterium]
MKPAKRPEREIVDSLFKRYVPVERYSTGISVANPTKPLNAIHYAFQLTLLTDKKYILTFITSTSSIMCLNMIFRDVSVGIYKDSANYLVLEDIYNHLVYTFQRTNSLLIPTRYFLFNAPLKKENYKATISGDVPYLAFNKTIQLQPAISNKHKIERRKYYAGDMVLEFKKTNYTLSLDDTQLLSGTYNYNNDGAITLHDKSLNTELIIAVDSNRDISTIKFPLDSKFYRSRH